MKLELSDLKTPDALNEYCRRTLGQPQQRGGVMIYPCPFGTHTRPKLQVTEYQGEGRFKCWACDRGGDVFDLHAGMNAQDTQRDFPGVLRGVCDVLGVRPPDDDGTPLPARRRPVRPRPVPSMAAAPPEEPSCFVSAPDEAELDACRERLALDEDLAGELAAELGLSPLMMLVHTDRTLGRGLLGVTPDNRLLYLYTAEDEDGNTRYTGAKLRRRDHHANPCLSLENGQWKPRGTMNPTARNKRGLRFLWPIGNSAAPWGLDSTHGKRFVIVTEGESDCLAIGQALEGFREAYQQDADPDTRRLVIFSFTRTISQAASLQEGDLFSCRICAAPNLKACSISDISPILDSCILLTSRQASTKLIPVPLKASKADKASTAWAWVNSTTPASTAIFPNLI